MALLVDTAKAEEARRAVELGFVITPTAKPSLLVEAGSPGLEGLHNLLDITAGPVFYQVTADTVPGRVAQARRLAKMAPGRLVVK